MNLNFEELKKSMKDFFTDWKNIKNDMLRDFRKFRDEKGWFVQIVFLLIWLYIMFISLENIVSMKKFACDFCGVRSGF